MDIAAPIRFCSLAVTLPKLHLIFGIAVSVDCVTFEPDLYGGMGGGAALYPEVPCTKL